MSGSFIRGYQIPKFLPELSQSHTYDFVVTLGDNVIPLESNFPSPLGFYVSYETKMNATGSTGGLKEGGKFASGSVVFAPDNQLFVTRSNTVATSLIHTDFKISAFGAFPSSSKFTDSSSFSFTPAVSESVPLSGSTISLVGSNSFNFLILSASI